MARAALHALSWEELVQQLKEELEFNPLDAENPPTVIPPDGSSLPMTWVVDGNRDTEANPEGKNSLALQIQIRKWELVMPDM